VRHGDVHNPDDVLYGRLPRFRLSERGRAEIALTGQALAREPVAAIYTSPRLRARQSAAVLARFFPNVPIHVSRLIDEVRTSWQGTPSELLRSHGFNFYEPPRAPDDESIAAVLDRMGRWMRAACRRYAGRCVIAISHADPIQIVKIGLLGKPLTLASLRGQEDYPAKGSVTRIVLADGQPPQLRYEVPTAAGTLQRAGI
jgi:probable phosphoglycerate mutase